MRVMRGSHDKCEPCSCPCVCTYRFDGDSVREEGVDVRRDPEGSTCAAGSSGSATMRRVVGEKVSTLVHCKAIIKRMHEDGMRYGQGIDAHSARRVVPT